MKRNWVLLLLVLLAFQSFGQDNLSLYNMRHIPQSVYANPANIPLGRLNISVPYFGSNHIQFGKSEFGSPILPPPGQFNSREFVSSLKDINSFSNDSTIEVFHIGFAVKKNYFFAHATQHINHQTVFPREAAVMIWEVGNQYDFFSPLELEGLNYQMSQYWEVGIGWARDINKKLNVGVHGKLLLGKSYFETQSWNMSLSTPFYGIKDNLAYRGMSDADFIATQNLKKLESRDYLEVPFENFGYSIDLGFTYEVTYRFRISGSVLNLGGTINWDDIKNYSGSDLETDVYTAPWENISAINGLSSKTEQVSTGVLKSTTDSVILKDFTTEIPTVGIGSISYRINPKLEATAVTELTFRGNEMDSRLRIGMQGRVKRFLNYMISYTFFDPILTQTNLGFGFAINAGPFQIHALSDNILVPFTPNTDYSPSLQFGANFTFGRDNE